MLARVGQHESHFFRSIRARCGKKQPATRPRIRAENHVEAFTRNHVRKPLQNTKVQFLQ